MITVFGATFGAVWPWLMLGVPIIAGLLVYIFRARGVSEPLVRSSLFLIRKLPEDQPSRKNTSFPPQFWLELLAFSALALGASGLFVTQRGERVAVVIDSSKSMSALLRQGETRLELARKLASADIAQSGDDTRFVVFSAADTLTQRSIGRGLNSYLSKANADQVVRSIKGEYLADSLQPLIAQITRSTEYDRIWIYSDYSNNPESNPELKLDRIKLVSVLDAGDGEQAPNTWVSSLKVVEGEVSKSWLEVVTASSGSGALKLSIKAACALGQDLVSQELPQVDLTLASLGSDMTTKLGPLPPDWRYCKVELKPERPDSLAMDDLAWIARPASSDQIALFGSLSPEELGLKQIKFASIVSGESVLPMAASGAIFHRSVPRDGSQLSSERSILVVNPPEGAKLGGLFNVAGQASASATGVEITRWEEAHPILRYLQPQLLNPPRASVLNCGEWGKPLLFSSSGPIACAGEVNGNRIAVVGFEILPFDGVKSAGVSILTLNLIKWVFDSTRLASADGAQVGIVALPYEAKSAHLIAPDKVQLSDRAARALRVASPGIVMTDREIAGAGKQQPLLAVNAISARESDLSRRFSVRIDSESDALVLGSRTDKLATKDPRDKTDLQFALTVAFLLVLAAEPLWRLLKRAISRRERS
jgi:hypothetical protein